MVASPGSLLPVIELSYASGDRDACSSFSDCDSYVAIATANRQLPAKAEAPSLASC